MANQNIRLNTLGKIKRNDHVKEEDHKQLSIINDESEDSNDDQALDNCHYNYYQGKNAVRMKFEAGKNYEKIKAKNFRTKKTTGFAIKKKYYQEGAERVAYFMREIDENNKPVGPKLIAKSTRNVVDDEI